MMAMCPRNVRPVTPSGRTVKYYQQLWTLQRYVGVSGILDDSGPSAGTCFDMLAHSLLLSRSLSVNAHAKGLPLMSTHLVLTWYQWSPLAKMSRQTQSIVQVNNFTTVHSRVTVGGCSMEYKYKLLCQFTTTVGGARCWLWLKKSQSNSQQGHTKRFSLYLEIELSGSG